MRPKKFPQKLDRNAFTGSFDGNDYTIDSLHISQPEESYIGLFGYVKGGTIRNINLENIDIEGESSVGGISGYNSGEIEDISVSGDISNDNTGGKTGGLIGGNNDGIIINCQTDVEVFGNGRDIGGLIGESTGDDYKVKDCSFAGDVYSLQSYGERVGG